MALKKLPGGVVVETTAGARLNEEAGVNLEAIHRQIIGAAVSAGQEAAEVATWPKGALVDANLDTLTTPGTSEMRRRRASRRDLPPLRCRSRPSGSRR